MIVRRAQAPIEHDLATKMVLFSGPRQCGKTTMVKALAAARHGAYYSWDATANRLAIQKRHLAADRPLWVFDELAHAWQVVLEDGHERQLDDIGDTRVRVLSARRLLANLP
jgi:hypothetical protein